MSKMRPNKKKISAIIIAKDEEKKVGDCLRSAKWVDEIILVDTGSMDKTINIAEKHGAFVFKYKGGSYSDWRNKGLKESSGKWVLYVDADERVTSELRKEIISIIKTDSHPEFISGSEDEILNQVQNDKFIAYAIPRRNIILGREMKHGGWWPDYVKRLYLRKSLLKWVGELHEEPVFKGEMGHLENPLTHIKHDNLSEMVEKTNKWSEIEAKLMFEAKHPPMNILRFASAILREFWLRMIKNFAFLDGTEGVIYACYQVYSKFISYAKLWEMQMMKNGQ